MKRSQNIPSSFRRKGLVSLLIFFHMIAFGQDNPTIWFQSIPTDVGFSQSYNFYIYHDSKGFVWISSDAGLNRFDGQKVKLYESIRGNSTSLLGENILGNFFEDDETNIWFSTTDAIHKYYRRTDQFSHFFFKSNSNDSLKQEYHTFAFENNKRLWVRSLDKIYHFDTQTKRDTFVVKSSYPYTKVGKNSLNQVCKIFTFGTEKGLDIFNIHNGNLLDTFPKRFSKYSISDVLYENDSLIWLSTKEKGLIRWNSITNNIFFIGDFYSSVFTLSKLDSNTLILAVQNHGIFQYHIQEEKLEAVTTRFLGMEENGSQGFWKIYIDDFKNIWISDKRNNIYFGNIGKNKFSSIPKFKTALHNSNYSIRTLLEDDIGYIWGATENAGIIKYNIQTKTFENYFSNDFNSFSIPSNMVNDLLLDNEKRVWASTSLGLTLYQDGNKFTRIKDENGEEARLYISLLDSNNGILVSSPWDGIFKVVENRNNKKLVNLYTPSNGEVCDYIFEDGDGNILVNFYDVGIGIFNYKKDELFLRKKIPLEANVNCFWEDPSTNILWMGTSMGLMKTSREDNYSRIEFVETKSKLPGKIISSILPGGSNYLWLGTNNGLVKLRKDSLTVEVFDVADGTQSSEFYINSALERKNELWFGGFDGITIVPTNKINNIKTIPQLKIIGIKINDLVTNDLVCQKTKATNVSEIKQLSRDYQDNTISLEFTALEFSDPSSNQLEYQLVGADKNPVRLEKGEYGFARYPNLPPGDYHFNLRGANSDGVWGDVQEVLMITIHPPFTQTKGFYFLMTLLFGGIIYGIYRYRIAQIRKTEMLNTRIAENKMSALRAQMNPHFIYNSMQTVNGIISRKDTMGAVKYINQFSRLMRMILENSRVGLVSVEKEIEFLISYIEIEKRRFQNPFSYNITVDDEVDTFDTEIPSMLTQPFVENAIKHGLFHKKEKGNIDIKFLGENGSLKCIIEDNGVGRAKTTILNAQSGRTHQSRGLQIVDERLELIRQSHPGNYKVKITDLFDLEQNASGTRVEITLPLQA